MPTAGATLWCWPRTVHCGNRAGGADVKGGGREDRAFKGRGGEGPGGAVMASDAFFPFQDSIEIAAQHGGVSAIIEPVAQ